MKLLKILRKIRYLFKVNPYHSKRRGWWWRFRVWLLPEISGLEREAQEAGAAGLRLYAENEYLRAQIELKQNTGQSMNYWVNRDAYNAVVRDRDAFRDGYNKMVQRFAALEKEWADYLKKVQIK
jgi:hypothetical protein